MGKTVIIGGVAGGATTAARLRRVDEKGEIVLIERGSHISYANCGLPYYIGGVITERDKLFVQTPEVFSKKFNLTVRVDSEAVKIDRTKKIVQIKDLLTGKTYDESYDKLVLSPGAFPLRPPIKGIDDDRIFTLRNVPDTDRIKEFIDNNRPKKAIVVGAGFIGIEMAENLHAKGLFVTIVEMADQVMTVLDFEMASQVHQHLKSKNVEFYLKDGVKEFVKNSDGSVTVKLSSGREISADIIILSIGVKPEVVLAKEAGLAIGSFGGITVNEYMQTDDPDIYALGDAVECKNRVLDKSVIVPLAGPANKQGRIVADNITFGNKSRYSGTIGTAIAKVFDMTVGCTGLTEKILKREKIPYISSITHNSSHAGYYPDAIPLTIKLIFSPDNGTIYGAQVVGYEGVDKRVDVIAAYIKMNKTIYDLEDFEHTYAPPFSSAKDPVNIAAFAAENIISGKCRIMRWDELLEADHSKLCLLDVRTAEETRLGGLKGSLNIPLDDLRSRMSEIPGDRKIVVYCSVGLRGYLAARILMQNGFDETYNLSGGLKTYEFVIQKQSNEDIYDKFCVGKDDSIYACKKDGDMSSGKMIQVDACGLQCPGPIQRLKREIDNIETGDMLTISSTDPGFYRDVGSWCNVTGNKLLSLDQSKGKIVAVIQKSDAKPENAVSSGNNNAKTIVVFSDDFDRALASFVIANGAASMGRKVTMFFTFWGLNVLKKPKKPSGVRKDFMGRMFGMMLPGSSKGLTLSKLNMGGMGTLMMRGRMKSKNVDSLEIMMRSAIESGITLIACQMSMDIMGVKKEELFDEVVIGGVANYLEEAEKSNLNLFV